MIDLASVVTSRARGGKPPRGFPERRDGRLQPLPSAQESPSMFDRLIQLLNLLVAALALGFTVSTYSPPTDLPAPVPLYVVSQGAGGIG